MHHRWTNIQTKWQSLLLIYNNLFVLKLRLSINLWLFFQTLDHNFTNKNTIYPMFAVLFLLPISYHVCIVSNFYLSARYIPFLSYVYPSRLAASETFLLRLCLPLANKFRAELRICFPGLFLVDTKEGSSGGDDRAWVITPRFSTLTSSELDKHLNTYYLENNGVNS